MQQTAAFIPHYFSLAHMRGPTGRLDTQMLDPALSAGLTSITSGKENHFFKYVFRVICTSNSSDGMSGPVSET